MTILTNQEIKKRLRKDLVISPYDEQNLMPASYNLSIGGSFVYDTMNFRYKSEDKQIAIKPHQFLLGTSYEKITLPDNIVGQVSGRSSYARLGLFIHTCAGYIDPGFSGEITFELYNCSNNPICIDIGDEIAQITFIECATANPSYAEIGNYNGQKGATVSRLLRY